MDFVIRKKDHVVVLMDSPEIPVNDVLARTIAPDTYVAIEKHTQITRHQLTHIILFFKKQGQCISMNRLGDVYGVSYTNWETDTFLVCSCDGGYAGPDCSYSLCPRGDNPRTTSDVDVQIRVSVSATSALDGDVALFFQNMWSKFSANGNSVGTQVCDNLISQLPFKSTTTCTQSSLDVATGSADYDLTLVFSGTSENNLFSHDGQITESHFTCDLTDVSSGDSPTCTVSILNAGSTFKEFEFCSGQGLCDFTKGQCKCFSGYIGLDCSTESDVVSFSDDATGFGIAAGSSSYTGNVLDLSAGRTAHSDFKFIRGTASSSEVFSVDGTGALTTSGGVSCTSSDVTVTTGKLSVSGSDSSIISTTSSSTSTASAATITYSNDAFTGSLLKLKSPDSTATDSTTFNALDVEFNGASVFRIRGDGQMGVEKAVFADGMIFQGTTSATNLAISGDTTQHGNVRVVRDDEDFSTISGVVGDALLLGHVGSGSTFEGSVIAATTDVTSPTFNMIEAVADGYSVFDVSASGQTTIYGGGLQVEAGGINVNAGGARISSGGMEIVSGGLVTSDGGVSTSNSAGLGLTVSEGGASITNSASNAASLAISATSSDFINTVAKIEGHATDATGYDLIHAVHDGSTKFSVRGDGDTHIQSTTSSSSSITGALKVDGGVGVGGNLHVAGTISDGTMSISGGVMTDVSSLTASGTIQGDTLTDGFFSTNLGTITGVSDMSMSGTLGVDTINAVSTVDSQTGFSVGGTQVLTTQQSAIAPVLGTHDPGDDVIGSLAASPTYDDVTMQDLIDHTESLRDWIEELTTKLNLALNTLEAHGLIAT